LCKHCLKKYNKPVVLQCGHDICLACAEDLRTVEFLKEIDRAEFVEHCSTQEQQSKRQVQITCPTCSAKTKLDMAKSIDVQLPFNTDLQQAIQSLFFEKPCANQCGKNAVVQCTTCQYPFCESCFQAAHQLAVFKSHVAVKIGQVTGPSICSKHQRELDVFCLTCNQVCCILCANTSHKGHEV
jgi:hypothetical protein